MGGGVGASVAVGPIGRQAEAALRLGAQGGAVCYSYSMSSGIFAGESLQRACPSSACIQRANERFVMYI